MGKRKISFIVFLLFLLLLCGCGVDKEEAVESVVEEERQEENQEEEEVYAAYCPLDGQGLEEAIELRPIAIMLGNNPSARPQYGMAEADLIYEFPAEGGITRFMAIYYHGQADKIGPVRSARPYFIDRALDWNSVYVHVGQSPQAQVYFKENKVAHIDEFSNAKFFWREKNRKAPDNLFTSTELLRKRMVELDYERPSQLTSFSFSPDAFTEIAEEAFNLEINYPEKLNKAVFTYDPNDKLYLRFTGGKPHLDGETNKQLQAKNIIVQYVDTKVMDKEGRLKVNMFGQGKILAFSEGRVIEGTWEKNKLREPTYFYDSTGKPLTLNPGQTWIQLVDKGTKLVVE